MRYVAAACLIISTLFACKEEDVNKVEMTITKKEISQYTPSMVVNKKDYACGMPVGAGITDTCHYQTKAYGFCSTECKKEFLKDPKKYLTTKP